MRKVESHSNSISSSLLWAVDWGLVNTHFALGCKFLFLEHIFIYSQLASSCLSCLLWDMAASADPQAWQVRKGLESRLWKGWVRVAA